MKYRYQSGDAVYEVMLERHGEGYRVTVNGETYDLEVLDAQPGALSLRFGQGDGPVRPQVVYWGAEGDAKWLSSGGCTYRLDRPQGTPPRRGGRERRPRTRSARPCPPRCARSRWPKAMRSRPARRCCCWKR